MTKEEVNMRVIQSQRLCKSLLIGALALAVTYGLASSRSTVHAATRTLSLLELIPHMASARWPSGHRPGGSPNQPGNFLYGFSGLEDAPHLVIRQRRADALRSGVSLTGQGIIVLKFE
jgi:hypothetical protein